MPGNRSLRVPCSPCAAARGQSLAEFALVVPLLLLVLLTVADFGRYFAASIAIESMARTSAEVSAQQYVQQVAAGTDPKNYALIHRIAWQSACLEAQGLPNMTPGVGGAECSDLPTLVCVHDSVDPTCGTIYNDGAGVPTQCGMLQAARAPTTAVDSQANAFVEVRICYRFSTAFPITIPFFDVSLTPLSGDFFIERARSFTVADY
jgi:Flp pilus assembly protein TadG